MFREPSPYVTFTGEKLGVCSSILHSRPSDTREGKLPVAYPKLDFLLEPFFSVHALRFAQISCCLNYSAPTRHVQSSVVPTPQINFSLLALPTRHSWPISPLPSPTSETAPHYENFPPSLFFASTPPPPR